MPERLRHLAAAVCLLVLAGPGRASLPPSAQELVAKARFDLARGDGVGAELHLDQALAAGAAREAVAARMGQALLDQNQRAKAREWLAPGKFAPEEAAYGFRELGRLERLDGNLVASGHAYDRAIAIAPRDAELWVEIGRLRYAGSEHMLAIAAADHALTLDPGSVRALEFRGQIVRDQYGLAAALPWFEAALARDPNDLSVLGEYAATLGELGRARDMVAVTRKMLQRDPRNPRAFYLQAVLAARAGDTSLARSLLDRAGGGLKAAPSAMLLDGVLQLRLGNYLVAIDVLDRLVQLQPANDRAQALLASAFYSAGNYKALTARFDALAAREDASPYLLTLVARAHEVLGERELAAPLLDRAARSGDNPFSPVAEGSQIGGLLAAHDVAAAEAAAEHMRSANPGSAGAQALAGDVQLALGHGAAALERYNLAARVRLPESLLLRLVAALKLSDHGETATPLIEAYLVQNPSSRIAVRLAAGLAVQQGDWKHARQLLEYLRDNGGGQDVNLLADLSRAQLRNGGGEAAEVSASEAYRLQPSNPAAAQAWGVSLAALKQRPEDARALLGKAKASRH